MVKRISFDNDGTLEVGDPPSLVTMDMVRAIKALGYVIGSGSDRPLSDQRHILENHHIVVDFMALKHQLAEVKAQFQAEAYYHIGDTDMDRFLADRAGFRFVRADAAVCQALGARGVPLAACGPAGEPEHVCRDVYREAGLNFTRVHSGVTSSKMASSGMSTLTASRSHCTTLETIRGPSSSCTTA